MAMRRIRASPELGRGTRFALGTVLTICQPLTLGPGHGQQRADGATELQVLKCDLAVPSGPGQAQELAAGGCNFRLAGDLPEDHGPVTPGQHFHVRDSRPDRLLRHIALPLPRLRWYSSWPCDALHLPIGPRLHRWCTRSPRATNSTQTQVHQKRPHGRLAAHRGIQQQVPAIRDCPRSKPLGDMLGFRVTRSAASMG